MLGEAGESNQAGRKGGGGGAAGTGEALEGIPDRATVPKGSDALRTGDPPLD